MGNPAKQTGWMSRNGYKLIFNELGIAVCPESGEKYEKITNYELETAG